MPYPEQKHKPIGIKCCTATHTINHIIRIPLILISDIVENSMICLVFTDSDLHKPLQAAFLKADCMIPGKYKKARLFCFETPHLYLCAVTETGARGSSWYCNEKDPKNTPPDPSNRSYFEALQHLSGKPLTF